MSAALRTMAGHSAHATRARRASDGVCAYQWSVDGTGMAITAIVDVPVFANTKLHAHRPKEASQ